MGRWVYGHCMWHLISVGHDSWHGSQLREAGGRRRISQGFISSLTLQTPTCPLHYPLQPPCPHPTCHTPPHHPLTCHPVTHLPALITCPTLSSPGVYLPYLPPFTPPLPLSLYICIYLTTLPCLHALHLPYPLTHYFVHCLDFGHFDSGPGGPWPFGGGGVWGLCAL